MGDDIELTSIDNYDLSSILEDRREVDRERLASLLDRGCCAQQQIAFGLLALVLTQRRRHTQSQPKGVSSIQIVPAQGGEGAGDEITVRDTINGELDLASLSSRRKPNFS